MMTQQKSLAWPLILSFIIILGWMAFEGILALVVGVGFALTLIWTSVGVVRIWPAIQSHLSGLAGRLAAFSAAGGAAGAVLPLVILALMVLKTGIHSHGPEYNPVEIMWVLSRFLPWGSFGVVIGLGIGLLVSALNDS